MSPASPCQVYSGLLNTLFSVGHEVFSSGGFYWASGRVIQQQLSLVQHPAPPGFWELSPYPVQGTEGSSLPTGPWTARPTAFQMGLPLGTVGTERPFPQRIQGVSHLSLYYLDSFVFCIQTTLSPDLNFTPNQALNIHVSRSVPWSVSPSVQHNSSLCTTGQGVLAQGRGAIPQGWAGGRSEGLKLLA